MITPWFLLGVLIGTFVGEFIAQKFIYKKDKDG